jgi:hypothetical protein
VWVVLDLKRDGRLSGGGGGDKGGLWERVGRRWKDRRRKMVVVVVVMGIRYCDKKSIMYSDLRGKDTNITFILEPPPPL